MPRQIRMEDLRHDDAGLTTILGMLDEERRYLGHEARWFGSDMPYTVRTVVDGGVTVGVPAVWYNAPFEVLCLVLKETLERRDDRPRGFSTRAIRDHMLTRGFVRAMRGCIPLPQGGQDTMTRRACKRARSRLMGFARAEDTLRFEVLWRGTPMDPRYVPMASAHPYAMVVELDPRLKDESLETVTFAVFHEMALCVCTRPVPPFGIDAKRFVGAVCSFKDWKGHVRRFNDRGWSFDERAAGLDADILAIAVGPQVEKKDGRRSRQGKGSDDGPGAGRGAVPPVRGDRIEETVAEQRGEVGLVR